MARELEDRINIDTFHIRATAKFIWYAVYAMHVAC